MQTTQQTSKWWLRYKTTEHTINERWFFFHHAGGSASSYARWVKFLPRNVEMLSVELPGRGNRYQEPFASQWHEVIPPIVNSIKPFLDRPFLFFGHSMGGSLAFEVCQSLRAHQQPLPEHLFIAGRQAPTRPRDLTSHHLPDNEFIEYLREKQGTPEEVLKDRDLMQLLIPRLKADFRLNDQYKPYDRPKLHIPITVFAGTTEEGERIDFQDWEKQTNRAFALRYFEGNHFFVNEHVASIIAAMQATIPCSQCQ